MVWSSLLTLLTAMAVNAQAAAQTAATGEVNHTFWYLSRAAGLCAYVMLCANVALGIAVSAPLLERFVMKWRIFDLHQFTGLFFLGLVGLHIFALLGDQYVGFTVPQLFVPWLSSYRSGSVAIGIFALYLAVLVTATFYIRKQIGQRTFRLIHYGSFVVFALSLLHSVFAGSDTGTGWAILLYAVTAIGIGALTWWRFGAAGGAAGGAASDTTARRPRSPARAT
jgi:predicted ferric reductase